MKLIGYVAAIILGACAVMAQSNPPTRLLQPRTVPKLVDTNGVTNVSNPEIEVLEREGSNFYDAGQYEVAIKAYTKLAARNTNDAAAAWHLASTYYMNGDMEHAADLYKRFAKLEPRNSYGHLWAGLCLSRLKKFEEAEPELRQAVRLYPKDAEAHEELAFCLERMHRYAEAAAEFERAIKYGGDAAYRCIEGGYNYAKAKDFPAAVRLLERGVMFDRTNTFAYDWLGWSYYRNRNYDKAAATFTQDLKIKPDRYYPQYWLGYSYLMDREYERASEAFAQVCKLKPTNALAHQAYAAVLLKCDRAGDAIKALEPFATSTNKSVRLTLFTAYVMNGSFQKAGQLYPVASTITAILVALAFVAGSALLLYKSFKPSLAEHVHLGFAIGWMLLYFESQIALILFAALFTSAKLLIGLLLAPIPLFVAAFLAFPKQPWGQAFRPARVGWKQVVMAAGGWLSVVFIAGVYAAIVAQFIHHRPEPRNIRFVLNLVHEHRVWAGVIVAVIAPITEEILFRGLLFSALSKWMKPTWVILVSAAIFGAIHVDAFYFFVLFLLGVLLGWARHSSKSIWFSVAIHMFQNGLAYTALVLG